MSLALNLPGATTIDWTPVSWRVDWQSILRTKAVKVAVECLTLLSVTAGLFSLFLGLSVL